jgi:hypothetical protein
MTVVCGRSSITAAGRAFSHGQERTGSEWAKVNQAEMQKERWSSENKRCRCLCVRQLLWILSIMIDIRRKKQR